VLGVLRGFLPREQRGHLEMRGGGLAFGEGGELLSPGAPSGSKIDPGDPESVSDLEVNKPRTRSIAHADRIEHRPTVFGQLPSGDPVEEDVDSGASWVGDGERYGGMRSVRSKSLERA